jgi:hypothetical protein
MLERSITMGSAIPTSTTMTNSQSEDVASTRLYLTVESPQPMSHIVAEHLLRLLALADADPADEYECYESEALVFVGLEPAVTSPFMDC